MAPRVGLEPTTTRLTAECSTIELSGIITLAATRSPADRASEVPKAQESLTTVFGMGTGVASPLSPPGNLMTIFIFQLIRISQNCIDTNINLIHHHQRLLPGQALDQLVPVSLKHYCSYTSGLSTSSSLWDLTSLTLWEILS